MDQARDERHVCGNGAAGLISGAPISRHLNRGFHLERGRQDRDDQAVQGGQQGRVKVVSDPARVRTLRDATDLKAIAAFK